MQPEQHETLTIVKVSFSNPEWVMLTNKASAGLGLSVSEYIHQVVMRNLRRRKAKKGNQS